MEIYMVLYTTDILGGTVPSPQHLLGLGFWLWNLALCAPVLIWAGQEQMSPRPTL